HAAGEIDLRHDPATENVAGMIGVRRHRYHPQSRLPALGQNRLVPTLITAHRSLLTPHASRSYQCPAYMRSISALNFSITLARFSFIVGVSRPLSMVQGSSVAIARRTCA